LRPQTAITCHWCGAAHHQDREARLVEAESAAKRLLLAGRRRPEPHVHRQAQQLDAVGWNAAADGDLPRDLSRGDDQVGLAEGPAAMEVDEVGDHSHQPAGPAAARDGLVADLVQERMHRQDDVRIVLLDQLDDYLAHARPEDCADGGEGRLGVAAVIDGAPRGARALDHGRVQRGEAPHHRWALGDQRVGDHDLAGRVELLQRVGQRPRRGAMAAACVAEEDQHAGRASRRSRLQRRSRQRSINRG
jgi:hypothetical protein